MSDGMVRCPEHGTFHTAAKGCPQCQEGDSPRATDTTTTPPSRLTRPLLIGVAVVALGAGAVGLSRMGERSVADPGPPVVLPAARYVASLEVLEEIVYGWASGGSGHAASAREALQVLAEHVAAVGASPARAVNARRILALADEVGTYTDATFDPEWLRARWGATRAALFDPAESPWVRQAREAAAAEANRPVDTEAIALHRTLSDLHQRLSRRLPQWTSMMASLGEEIRNYGSREAQRTLTSWRSLYAQMQAEANYAQNQLPSFRDIQNGYLQDAARELSNATRGLRNLGGTDYVPDPFDRRVMLEQVEDALHDAGEKLRRFRP